MSTQPSLAGIAKEDQRCERVAYCNRPGSDPTSPTPESGWPMVTKRIAGASATDGPQRPPRREWPDADTIAGRTPPRSSWRILQHPGFRLYFAGSLASNLGTWLQNTAQVLLAYQLTHSVFAVGMVTCAQFSGFLLLGPWAAVLAHRVGGRQMLIGTQLISAALAGALTGLEAAGLLGESLLIAGALGLGLAFAFALPLQTAMVPRLVPDTDTKAAMAINSVSYNAGRALAPVLSVVVIATSGFAWAFALNAASFLVFAFTLTKLRPSTDDRPVTPPRVSDTVKIALRQPRVGLLLAMVAAVTLADDPVLVLSPALAHHVLGTSSHWAGYFLSALGCGTVLGSLIPARGPRSSNPSHESRRVAWSLVLLAGAIVCFTAGITAWVSLLAAFVAGIAGLLAGATTQTLLVRREPRQAQNVMVLWAIAWAGTKPLASLADGWLASATDVRVAGLVLTLPAIVLAILEICLSKRNKYLLKSQMRRTGASIAFPKVIGDPGLPRDPESAAGPSSYSPSSRGISGRSHG